MPKAGRQTVGRTRRQTGRQTEQTGYPRRQADGRLVCREKGPRLRDNLPLIIASARTAVAAGVSELAKMMTTTTTTTLARTKVDLQRKELISEQRIFFWLCEDSIVHKRSAGHGGKANEYNYPGTEGAI